MATINTDYISPVELSGTVRGAVDEITAHLPLQQWLPNQDVQSLQFDFDATDPSQDTARYRAFDTPAPYGREVGTVRKSGTIPPISQKMRVSEYAQLILSGQLGALTAAIEKYAINSARDIAFRLEAARADVLRTGKLVLNENGLKATIDFGRHASLSPAALTGNAVWTNAASTPIDNVLAWRTLPQARKQPIPTRMLVTSDVMDALSTNPQVIAAYYGRTDDLTGRITFEQVTQVFTGYNLFITVVDQAYQEVGLASSFFPAGTVMLLPSPGYGLAGATLGSTDIGVPAEALEPAYGIPEEERAGLFAGVFSKTDPQGLDVLVSAIAVPVVSRPNSTVSTTVL